MKPEDLRIDVFRSGSTGWYTTGLRITHLPTGIAVEGEGPRLRKLNDELIEKLKEKLNELQK